MPGGEASLPLTGLWRKTMTKDQCVARWTGTSTKSASSSPVCTAQQISPSGNFEL